MISKLRGQMLNMSRHKFASNVCEKALVTADSESRRLLIEEIMSPKQDGVSPIVTMMKDQFASELTLWLPQLVLIPNCHSCRLCFATSPFRRRRRTKGALDQ